VQADIHLPMELATGLLSQRGGGAPILPWYVLCTA